MAVRNEERAFAFWSYVAAQATMPEIQQAAETMAREELGHVATLRRERRRAFHANRSAGAESVGDKPVQDAAFLEQRLADLLDPLAALAPEAEQIRMREFAQEARGTALELKGTPIAMPAGSQLQVLPDNPIALAELLTERYLEAADSVRDEGELLRVQRFAGRAIARLAWLRSDLPELRRSEDR
jgi:hypothetical protein